MSLNDSQIAEVQQQIQTLLSSSYNCAVSHDDATNTLVYGKCGVDDSGSNILVKKTGMCVDLKKKK